MSAWGSGTKTLAEQLKEEKTLYRRQRLHDRDTKEEAAAAHLSVQPDSPVVVAEATAHLHPTPSDCPSTAAAPVQFGAVTLPASWAALVGSSPAHGGPGARLRFAAPTTRTTTMTGVTPHAGGRQSETEGPSNAKTSPETKTRNTNEVEEAETETERAAAPPSRWAVHQPPHSSKAPEPPSLSSGGAREAGYRGGPREAHPPRHPAVPSVGCPPLDGPVDDGHSRFAGHHHHHHQQQHHHHHHYQQPPPHWGGGHAPQVGDGEPSFPTAHYHHHHHHHHHHQHYPPPPQPYAAEYGGVAGGWYPSRGGGGGAPQMFSAAPRYAEGGYPHPFEPSLVFGRGGGAPRFIAGGGFGSIPMAYAQQQQQQQHQRMEGMTPHRNPTRE